MEAPARERGPAEELVAKRLKPLNKKIQRFKNYVTQPAESLNADQRSAVASLPALEAVAKELEEVMKAMEEVELVAAAKAREQREAAARLTEATLQGHLRAHAIQVAGSITQFMNLHSLLHPARPSDIANLTFAPLTLPLRLQDEVLATDILRVGRMYDDLSSGGDGVHSVLDVLAAGPSGEDEENDHIHHLLSLLSAPTEPSSVADDSDRLEVGSNQAEPAMSMRDDVSTIAGDDFGSYAPSEVDDPQRTPVMSRGLDFDMSRGAALNFLQEDELALPPPIPAITVDVAVVQSYEVIEPVSATMSEAAEVLSTPQTPMDWTAEDDDTDTEDVVAGVTAAVEAVALDATPKKDAGAKEKKDNQNQNRNDQRKRRAPRKDGAGGGSGSAQSNGREPSNRNKDSEKGKGDKGEKKVRAQGKGRPAGTVDEDGFETKVSRRASTSAGAGRGRGQGQQGGRGRGGRGGAPRDGRGANSKDVAAAGAGASKDSNIDANSTPRKNKEANGATNGNASNKDAAAAAATPKPKPSIYKTTQPTGPASAPIF